MKLAFKSYFYCLIRIYGSEVEVSDINRRRIIYVVSVAILICIELYPKPMTRPKRNSLVHVDSKARVGQLHGTLKNRIARIEWRIRS